VNAKIKNSASTKIITHFSDIIAPYNFIICDIWGVLHNGVACFKDAHQVLSKAREQNKTVILLSNAPRPSHDVIPQLTRLGVPQDAYNAIVTSGDITQNLLRERANQNVFLLGPERDLTIFDGLNMRPVSLDHADLVLCTGLFDDGTETPADYQPLLQKMLERGLHMLCANPDLVVERGAQLIFCAGAIADLYAKMGGKVTLIGKPFEIAYEQTFLSYEILTGQKADKNTTIAIGDAIRTDIKGANQFGIASLFIAAGIHAHELMQDSKQDSKQVSENMSNERGLDNFKTEQFLQQQTYKPEFIIRNLVW
jgi:HAD superfamily hydrolase (TIGR01459 family)